MAVRDSYVSSARAAEMLDVSSHEVRRLVNNGDLRGEQIAGRWLFEVEDVQRLKRRPRVVGRPFSPSASWAVLRILANDVPEHLSSSRLWQLRQYLDQDPWALAAKLRGRAERRSYHVHSSLVSSVREHPSVLLSGLSAADSAGADLIVRDDVAEGYIHENDVGHVVDEFQLREAADSRANVVLHVVAGGRHLPFQGRAPSSLVALDLIESGEPRACDAGWRLWREALAPAAS